VRVLLVSHRYPPEHVAGTELYTARLAGSLRARGHEVAVLATRKDIGRRHLALERRTHEGTLVLELVNNLRYRSFRETWDSPAIDARFAAVLDELRPELVHFQHLLHLSVGCVEEAARRGLPVVYTLHDFWLQCARYGQRLHVDGTVCHTIEVERCAGCLARFEWGQSPLEQRLAGWIAGLRGALGLDLSEPARRARERLRAGGSTGPAAPAPPEEIAAMAGEVRARERGMRERVVPGVDLFLSPSRFVRDRMVEWGLPAERVRRVPTGVDRALFAGRMRAPRGARLRLRYVGSLAPHKGVDVLLRAWELVPEELRRRGELEIIGPSKHAPEYQRLLAELAGRTGVPLAGALAPAEIAQRLAATDLLVVPSVWYENAPLVILEALAARTPVAVSRLGGMAELVEEGSSGFHFAPGDPADLARLLRELLEHPERLDALDFRSGGPPDLAEHAREVEGVYRELLAQVPDREVG
jgi:glycosyltransferase involved in cell wall biosynthesis